MDGIRLCSGWGENPCRRWQARPGHQVREAALAEYAKVGCVACEFSTRLALGEIEISSGRTAAGRSRLSSLENDARGKSFLLIAVHVNMLEVKVSFKSIVVLTKVQIKK
jgi:hypothetical protein